MAWIENYSIFREEDIRMDINLESRYLWPMCSYLYPLVMTPYDGNAFRFEHPIVKYAYVLEKKGQLGVINLQTQTSGDKKLDPYNNYDFKYGGKPLENRTIRIAELNKSFIAPDTRINWFIASNAHTNDDDYHKAINFAEGFIVCNKKGEPITKNVDLNDNMTLQKRWLGQKISDIERFIFWRGPCMAVIKQHPSSDKVEEYADECYLKYNDYYLILSDKIRAMVCSPGVERKAIKDYFGSKYVASAFKKDELIVSQVVTTGRYVQPINGHYYVECEISEESLLTKKMIDLPKHEKVYQRATNLPETVWFKLNGSVAIEGLNSWLNEDGYFRYEKLNYIPGVGFIKDGNDDGEKNPNLPTEISDNSNLKWLFWLSLLLLS